VTVPTIQVRDVADVDRPWLRELVASLWGLPVVTAVRAYEDPQRLDGVIAEVDGEPVGAVTFHVDGTEWEVVTVNAVRSGVGAGRAMLEGLRRRAKAAGASRVWLITTDTNDGAIGFYEHLGMSRVRLHRRFVDVVRAAKPDVDEGAFCHAIEFEWRIGLGSASDHSPGHLGRPAARSRPVSAAPSTSDGGAGTSTEGFSTPGPSDTRCPSRGGTTQGPNDVTIPALGATS
jgi:GNAT superfamily N-acetyltransferase